MLGVVPDFSCVGAEQPDLLVIDNQRHDVINVRLCLRKIKRVVAAAVIDGADYKTVGCLGWQNEAAAEVIDDQRSG